MVIVVYAIYMHVSRGRWLESHSGQFFAHNLQTRFFKKNGPQEQTRDDEADQVGIGWTTSDNLEASHGCDKHKKDQRWNGDEEAFLLQYG